MKLKLALSILALAIPAICQTTAAAKPETETLTLKKVAPVAPAINTSRVWRLNSKAQQLRMQLAETPAAKAVAAAEAEVNAEQEALAKQCTDAGFILSYDNNPQSKRYQDLACVEKPKEQAPTPPPTTAKKEQ